MSTTVRHDLAARLAPLTVPGRPVDPLNWHVSLHFIGEVAPPIVDRVVHALDESELGPPFRVRWGGLGAFPRPAKANVLWVGPSTGSEELGLLSNRVGSSLEAAGLPGEARPFRPHLTLARVRPPLDLTDLVASVEPLDVVMPVDRVELVASRFEGRSVRYEIIESFDLG